VPCACDSRGREWKTTTPSATNRTRHLFDFSVGTDNLFRGEHTKVTLRDHRVNITNKIALYNFLSTSAGRILNARAIQVQAGVNFLTHVWCARLALAHASRSSHKENGSFPFWRKESQ